MGLFIVGMVVFFGVHLFPILVNMRQNLIGVLGGTWYKTVFAILSVVGFLLMLYGWRSLPYVPVFQPPAISLPLSQLVMLPAFILLVAAYIPCRIRRWVGHPMIFAVLLWSLVHVLANGDQASLLLFGAFLLYSIANWISMVQRQSGEPAKTRPHYDWIVVAVGISVYFGAYYLHGELIAPIG